MSNTHPHPMRTFNRKEAVGFSQLVRKREDKNYAAIPVGVDSLEEALKWREYVSSPEEYLEAFRVQATKKRIEDFLARSTGLLPAAAMSGWLKKHEADHGYFDEAPRKVIAHSHHPHIESKERQWRGQIKKEVSGLLESGETEEEVSPAAVEYACQVVDQLPFECTLLPSPDVSGFADKKAVYFEWLLETDGRLLLTVEPDGTVAYVCTFGNARSRNLGAWEDGIVDLMRPCFVKLVQLHKKDFHAWDASRTAHLSPDLSSKAKR